MSFHALYHQILLPMRGSHIFNGGVDICQPVGPINNWRNNDIIAKQVMPFLDALASLDLKLSVSEWVSDLPFFKLFYS